MRSYEVFQVERERSWDAVPLAYTKNSKWNEETEEKPMKTAGKLLEGPGTRSVEDVHHLRLMALLKDMVRQLGPGGAAEALGIDRKTIWRGLSAGRLSPRLADALERLLLEEGVADSAHQLERIEALERRVDELTGVVNALGEGMREAFEAVRREIDELRDRGSRGVGKTGLRLAGLDSLRRRATWASRAGRTRERRGRRTVERMLDPMVVTREFIPGDEEVYGAAWPLVNEWRNSELRRETGTKLERARTRERIMELEVSLIEDHGLTLPPATSPMHPSEKSSYLDWRRRSLDDLRRERVRLEVLSKVRWVLTFGLWQE